MNEQLMDENSAKETYKFLNALLDDYNACKTDLARNGIFKAYRLLMDRASEDHLKQIEKSNILSKELADTKAKLPKTKEEITKLLHEAGFHELEECESGTWHCQISPDLSPKAYAELYKKYYGDLQIDAKDKLPIPERFDPKTDSFKDFAEVKKTCSKTMAKIAIEEANDCKKNIEDDLDKNLGINSEDSFSDKNISNNNSKNTKKKSTKAKIYKSKTKNIARIKSKFESKKV